MKEAFCGVHNWTECMGEQKTGHSEYGLNMRERVGGPRPGVPGTTGTPLNIHGHPKKREQAIQRHHYYPISASTRSTAQGDPEMGCLGSHLGR